MRAEVPQADSDDVLVWRHSGEGLSPPRPISEQHAKKAILAYYFLWGALTLFWLTRPGAFEYLISFGFVLQAAIIVALFYFGPRMIAAIQSVFRNGRQPESTAIPLWMSENRIAYSSGDKLIDETLEVGEILSAAPDFAMGSPALCLHLKDRTIKLISSELGSLKEHLYSLRPDLRPGG